MIKIVSDNIEEALNEHWKWVKRRFNIRETPEDDSVNHQGCLSKDDREELFELLGFIGDEKQNIEELKNLICTPPNKLKIIKNDCQFASLVKNKINAPDEYIKWKAQKKQTEEEKEKYKDYIDKERNRNRVRELLGYDSLYKTEKNSGWSASELCNRLKISICPYCNRQYVFTTFKEDMDGKEKWVSRPQLDHYYPKSIYPFLSCSFYNLIPSCPICNMGKNDNDKETIYPYLESFNNDDGSKRAQFIIESDHLNDIVKLGNVDPNIDYNIKLNVINDPEEHVKGSDEVFNLTILYNEHQLELHDLLKRFVSMKGAELGDYSNVILGKKIEDCGNKEIEYLKKFILGLPLMIDRNQQYILKKFKEDIIDFLDEQEWPANVTTR